MSPPFFAQVSQYFRPPHHSTILAKMARGGRPSEGKGRCIGGVVPVARLVPSRDDSLRSIHFRVGLLILACRVSS